MAKAFAMVPRDARAALRDLLDSDYKVLLQLLLTKQQGQTIICGYEMLADITGTSGRALRDVIPRLVARNLITYVPGKALGRGKGNGPCRVTVLPLPTALDEPALMCEIKSNSQTDVAPAISVSPTSAQRQPNVSPTSAIQENIRQEDVVVDACDQPATTTTAARASDYFSDSQPSRPSPAQRLVWLAERGIHVDAAPDTRGRWAIETDALSLDDLRAILPPGRKLPRWPSDFAKLRAAWSADTPDAQIQAERTGGERQARRAAEAAAVAAATAQRIREDQLAAAQRQAAQRDHDAALATPLGRRWRGLLSAWGSAVPGCMRSVGTYPLALADGRLVLHVGNPVVEALMRRHELAVLDRCRDAFAPDLVDHLDLIVNGHAHPTIAALPAVAVLAH